MGADDPPSVRHAPLAPGRPRVGGPEEVAEKILFQHELFGHQRFLAQMSVGDMPHDRILRAIELLGTEVAPVVRREVERARPRCHRARRWAVGRLGLEPRSHGLTCRTGSHRPLAARGTRRCGLDHLFTLGSTLGRAAYGL